MPRCRCHSRKQEKRCCGPFHAGRPAPTPLALMRSRYSAFAKGLVDYVIATTDPDGPQWEPDRNAWRASLQATCRATRYTGLDILEAPPSDGDTGEVTFRAHLSVAGQDRTFVERSAFRRIGERWHYVGPLPR